jgi:steroid Delta-isomerase
MASSRQLRTVIEAHVAAVGAADPTALAALYAPNGRLHDPAGGQPVVGRAAIARHFARWLDRPRQVHIVTIVLTGQDAAVYFRAVPADGQVRDIIDTMTFDDQAMITEMRAYAG